MTFSRIPDSPPTIDEAAQQLTAARTALFHAGMNERSAAVIELTKLIQMLEAEVRDTLAGIIEELKIVGHETAPGAAG